MPNNWNNKVELEHYGKKGMRWGVRKQPERAPQQGGFGRVTDAYGRVVTGYAKYNYDGVTPSNVRSSATGQKHKAFTDSHYGPDGSRTTYARMDGVKSKAYKDIRPEKQRKTDVLSNEELRRTIERMELEQRYSQLSAMDLTPGQKIRQRIMNKAVDVAVEKGTSMVVDAALKGVRNKASNVDLASVAGKFGRKKNEKGPTIGSAAAGLAGGFRRKKSK